MQRYLPIFLIAAMALGKTDKPNVILLALDDFGWADAGYQGSDFPTPHIDALVGSGIKLERMYAMPQCSPTRSSLLTGRYAHKIGMQHFSTIFPGASAGIPLDTPTIAELFQEANYTTAMIGKWHVGYSTWAQTPTERGFDSHLGYLQGQTDYYNRTLDSCDESIICLFKGNQGDAGFVNGSSTAPGFDFWENQRPAVEQFGQYTADSYNTRAEQLVAAQQNSTRPMFMYFAEQQLHIPLQAPPQPEHLERCRHVVGGSAAANRTVLCAMASKLDESVGKLVANLKKYGQWEKTLIWAVSDNGGMTHFQDSWPASASSNWPLRGGKATLFEGGVKAVSFIAGGYLPKEAPTIYNSLMHVSDVLPTLAHIVGVSLPADVDFDGVNMWPAIMGQPQAEQRIEVPLNIDTNPLSQTGIPSFPQPTDGLANFSSIIVWPWKLITGVSCNPGLAKSELLMDGWWTVKNYSRILPPTRDDSKPMLFNLETDQTEHHDVAAQHPEVVKNMTARIQDHWASKEHGFKRAQLNVPLPLSNPKFHDWHWAPFRPSIRHSKYGRHKHADAYLSHIVG